MILENGYIELYCKSGATFDENHNPVAPTYNTVSIPCQYEQTTRNNDGSTEGGRYTISAYNVFIDIAYSDSVQSASKLKLVSTSAGELGTFEMPIPRYLTLVSQIKISV